MEHPKMKETDGPLKDALYSLCAIPRDIDRLCPCIGEPVYIDAD